MRKRDLKDKQTIQAAVRQVADEYLKDPNINSVGIGHKMKDGKRTGELALQFTVGQKLAPEALEAVATRPSHQREGLGSLVISEVGELIDRTYRLGALATGVVGFYERLGWVAWKGPTFVRTAGGLVRTAQEASTGRRHARRSWPCRGRSYRCTARDHPARAGNRNPGRNRG